MEFFKTLLEYGKEFTEVEFTAIYRHMKQSRLLNEDSLRIFSMLANGVGLEISRLIAYNSTDDCSFEELARFQM